jgi:hypothetical protein
VLLGVSRKVPGVQHNSKVQVSRKVPGVQHSSKVQVSRDIGKMMGTPPLPGRDISSSISKAG